MKPLQTYLGYRLSVVLFMPVLLCSAMAVRAEPKSESVEADSRSALPADAIRIAIPAVTKNRLSSEAAKLTTDREFDVAWLGELPFRSTIHENLDEFYRAIIAGEADVMPMLIEDYLKRPEECRVEPVLLGVAEDGAGTRLVLLARDGLDLAGLAGRKLLLDKSQALTNSWLDLLLAEADLPESASHFASLGDRSKAGDVVLQVFFGKADACVTSMEAFSVLAEVNPQLSQRIQVLAVSQPMAMRVICMRPGLDVELREQLIAGLRNLHQSPGGQQLLMLTKLKCIELCDPALVETAQSIYNDWQKARDRNAEKWLEKQKQQVTEPLSVAAKSGGIQP